MKSKNDYTLVARELSGELIKEITGENEEWLFGKRPSDYISIGMISSSLEEGDFTLNTMNERNDYKSIPSIGMRFRVNKIEDKMLIKLRGKLFYRVEPTYEMQKKYLLEKYSNKYASEIEKPFEDAKTLSAFLTSKVYDKTNPPDVDEIIYLYKSIKLSDLGYFEIDLNNPVTSFNKINKEINEKLLQQVDLIKKDSRTFKSSTSPTTDLLDEEKFNIILNESMKTSLPVWKIELDGGVTDYDDYYEVLIQLTNKSPKNTKYNGHEIEIFNAGIDAYTKYLIYISLNSNKHYYLDDPSLPGIGNNCSVEYKDGIVSTLSIPVYEEKRVVTVDKYSDYVSFNALIDDPVKNLSYILNEMKNKLDVYDRELKVDKKEKNLKYIKDFEEEIDNFENEIRRFEYGIELINNYTDIRKSFELMNRTFAKNKKYKGWRLFQIVFIVSLIADAVNSEYENTGTFLCNDINNVDLLYFPTGGGKTESFLGCSLFASFFDRIRGKEDGVTTLMKYPLRLLAAQQLDRVLQLTIYANEVKHEFNIPGEDFSVGFFAGNDNTPNKIDSNIASKIDSFDQDAKNRFYRQLDTCPLCGSDMNVMFDRKEWKLKHVCKNEKCKYEPMMYIVDDEIYRYAPTFVISTLDKMANIGLNARFKSLFGQVACKCPVHGYSNKLAKCSVNDIPGAEKCTCALDNDIERKDPVPTFVIQDELHLVNQSLGTFDSHYESLIKYYCLELLPKEDRKKIKYIGATATITDYKKQIYNLYHEGAKQFPTTVKKGNFYSYIDQNDTCRVIYGLALFGSSVTDNIRKLITIYRINLCNWRKNPDVILKTLKSKGFEGTKNELIEILDDYLISIEYNNSKNDAGVIAGSLQKNGNDALKAAGFNDYIIREISGDVEFKDVKNVIHEVEKEGDIFDKPNAIIATSAISHGVDVDSFNQIYFYGLPIMTSEYIQAYSRVGRKNTGIVFDIFRLVRDRDKSFLKNFEVFHKYKELLIDPVAINRYAKNAVYCTLPGIFSALLLQKYVQSYKAVDVTKAIDNGLLTKEKLLEDIYQIYGCEDVQSKMYEEIIACEVDRMFNAFTMPNGDAFISAIITNANSKHKAPMRNLRDVDINLQVDLEGD